ncbi:ubiquitin related modifier 1 [Ramicandelaber brevisporus]|nr:ubiquitin related modifier 1 [Ramicandelaber brevisporus]
MRLTLEFKGGMELLFGNQHKKEVTFSDDDPKRPKTIGDLLPWIKDNLLVEKPELFMSGATIRPGILVLINEADWELEGETECEINDKDQITFISTLHGG